MAAPIPSVKTKVGKCMILPFFVFIQFSRCFTDQITKLLEKGSGGYMFVAGDPEGSKKRLSHSTHRVYLTYQFQRIRNTVRVLNEIEFIPTILFGITSNFNGASLSMVISMKVKIRKIFEENIMYFIFFIGW
jgi:hypothetical protein